MRHLLHIAVVLASVLAASSAFAYRSSHTPISEAERGLTAEEALTAAEAGRSRIAASVNTAKLDDHRRNPKIRLTRGERRSAKSYEQALARISFWKEVVGFKEALLALHGKRPPPGAEIEADLIARVLIDKIHELSSRWKIGGSALLHNMKINLGFREKGFCYHFASELRKAIARHDLEWFDSRWGSAWEGEFRESNALVITAKGRPFESGLAVDPWRTAGKPFWTTVKGDRFPWVEGFDVEERYEVE